MTEPLHLPQLTIVAITDRDHGKTIEAIDKTLKIITPLRTILFSDVYIENPLFECIVIDPLRSIRSYNEWVTWKLGMYIESSHILLIQHDGYVIDGSAWTDEFLEYDYIGAPWGYKDGRNVGNGGFSIRSKRLHDVLASDPKINIGSPEDEIICRLFRHYLEETHGIKYAPEALAHKFSFEMHKPLQKTFGFHNTFHEPYKEPIILRRTGAMGDVVMLEPVMEWFYIHDYRVILDSFPDYYNLFYKHHFKVEHTSFLPGEDTSSYRRINLDMAYEVKPKQLVLKTYFEFCGIKDYTLRNPQLNFFPTTETKLFDRYVVVHVDDTGMPHRNVYGIDWEYIRIAIEGMGYEVIQIGRKTMYKAGIKINTPNDSMLAYVISGADLFVGIDSGCAQVAVACGVRSVIFFGSVDPKLRYPDMEKIIVIQNKCPIAKDGCYHTEMSTTGVKCEVDERIPTCCTHETDDVIKVINCLL